MLYSPLLSFLLFFQLGSYVAASPQQSDTALFVEVGVGALLGAGIVAYCIISWDNHRVKNSLDSLKLYADVKKLSINDQKAALNQLQAGITKLQQDIEKQGQQV